MTEEKVVMIDHFTTMAEAGYPAGSRVKPKQAGPWGTVQFNDGKIFTVLWDFADVTITYDFAEAMAEHKK